LALGAFGALTATFIVALALMLPLWASALIVTLVYAVIAAVAAQRGLASQKKVQAPVPEQTIETLQEDVDAVRAGVQRGR
jgi:membrane protein implicated in regulation of membrane protease activity